MGLMKKAQGLPITTIVLIVIVLIVLIAVALFFFSGFDKATEQTDPSINIAKCQARCATAKSLASKLDNSNVDHVKDKSGFCSDVECDEVVECELTWNDGTTSTLTC